MRYKFKHTDAGLCRVYLQNTKGELYCLMGIGVMDLYSCTSSGEPLCREEIKEADIFELPKNKNLSDRDSSLIVDCIETLLDKCVSIDFQS